MAFFRSSHGSAELEPPPPGEGPDIPLRREELILVRSPFSSVAEQFRRMRNSIQALNPDGASRTILITSAVEGEGKSVATLNLALAMAELPHLRVLVVDVSMLNPSVEDYLGLPRRQGFAELLTGELTIDQAVRATSVPRFDVIGLGNPPANPAINVDRVRAVLNAVKRRYDYVLLDAPSVLTANHPSVMGSISDGILVVVRMGKTAKQQVEEANAMLENLGGNLLGTVAIAVDDA